MGGPLRAQEPHIQREIEVDGRRAAVCKLHPEPLAPATAWISRLLDPPLDHSRHRAVPAPLHHGSGSFRAAGARVTLHLDRFVVHDAGEGAAITPEPDRRRAKSFCPRPWEEASRSSCWAAGTIILLVFAVRGAASRFYRWLHGGVGKRGFPAPTSSGQTTTCLPSCHWIVIAL